MKARRTAVLAGLAALVALPLHAQTPLSLEVRAGLGIPVGDFTEIASPGLGLGGSLVYRIAPMVGLYAGYSWQSFGEETGWDETIETSQSGFAAGARLHVQNLPSTRPWIGAGMIANQLSMRYSWTDDEWDDVSSGVETWDSDYSFGFEAEAGLELPVGPRISLTPVVGYRRYTLREGNFTAAHPVSYFSVQLGGSVAF
jgi:hypothetical protein